MPGFQEFAMRGVRAVEAPIGLHPHSKVKCIYLIVL
jgi:hypothetical protein